MLCYAPTGGAPSGSGERQGYYLCLLPPPLGSLAVWKLSGKGSAVDPTQALKWIRHYVAAINSTRTTSERAASAQALVAHIEDLDEWLSGGGFLPDQWRENRV